jgi:hypothetical protein
VAGGQEKGQQRDDQATHAAAAKHMHPGRVPESAESPDHDVSSELDRVEQRAEFGRRELP